MNVQRRAEHFRNRLDASTLNGMSGVVIIGAGGHGREIHDVIAAAGVEFAGFVADGHVDREQIAPRGPYLGGVAELERLDVEYVIAIGDGEARRKLDVYATSLGRRAAVLIHPRAVVGGFGVRLGPGTVVCAGAQVTTDVTVGRHVHFNRGAQAGHDCRFGDYVTLHPGSVASGGVVLGDGVTLGTNATVIPRVTVGGWTTVGAGGVVVRDLPAEVTAVGVPVRTVGPEPACRG